MGKQNIGTVELALMTFAKVITIAGNILDDKGADPAELYYAREFLPEMQTLFIEQVVTSIPTHSERRKLIKKVKLEYLYEQMRALEKEWDRM